MKIEFFDIFFKFDPEIHVFLYFWMNLRYLVKTVLEKLNRNRKDFKNESILKVASASMTLNTKKSF